jgi:hypothetical protein
MAPRGLKKRPHPLSQVCNRGYRSPLPPLTAPPQGVRPPLRLRRRTSPLGLGPWATLGAANRHGGIRAVGSATPSARRDAELGWVSLAEANGLDVGDVGA